MEHGRHNLLLAIQPEPAAVSSVAQLMESLRRDRGFAGQPISRDCLHITLSTFGRYQILPDELIERIGTAASTVTMSRFAVALNHLVSWKRHLGKQPLVLFGDDGVIGVDLLSKQLHGALLRIGFEQQRVGRKIPHLTLAYGGQTLSEEVIAPIRWTVCEFVLIDSLVGEGRHLVLNRWPLGSADAALSGTPSSP